MAKAPLIFTCTRRRPTRKGLGWVRFEGGESDDLHGRGLRIGPEAWRGDDLVGTGQGWEADAVCDG